MHFISPIFDLYSDYLIVNSCQATATGLAALVEGNVSHDAITRSLGEQTYGSAQLWQVVKPLVRQIQQPDGVLILDDTIEGKPFTQTNNLIRYHYDHCQGKAIKGINQLTALYYSGQNWLPVAFHLIQKDKQSRQPKTGTVGS